MDKCIWVRPEIVADRIPRMDPLGPSTAFKVRGATRGQGRTQGDQGARRRRVITLAILSLPIIEVANRGCGHRDLSYREPLPGGSHNPHAHKPCRFVSLR